MTVEIRSGWAIAVDPDSLRELADRLGEARGWIESGAGDARAAIDVLWRAPGLAHACSWQVDQVRHRIVLLGHDIEDLAGRIRSTANAYELVDLMFRMELSALRHPYGDADAAHREELQARIDEITAADDEAAAEARAILAEWDESFAEGEQLTPVLNVLGPFVVSLAVRALYARTRARATGVISAGARLREGERHGTARAVAAGAATVPLTLADAASRIPGTDAAQIRVEKYTMADGSAEFAVYFAGTSVAEEQVFDWQSNLDLYFGERSAAFDAAMSALVQSGAQPGDTVHAYGFSQGAMIAARLAVEGDFRVETLVGLGSPVEADLGDDVLSVQLRHTDDPISLLAHGGMPGGTGSPESIVVERAAHPEQTIMDITAPAHRLDEYVATAEMAGDSGDVRVDSFRSVLERLRASAVGAEYTEYHAELARRELSGPPASRDGASDGVSASSTGDAG